MEKKSIHNLEKSKFSNLMVGFCYVSGITLAVFSYGELKEIPNNKKVPIDTNQFYITQADTKKELPQPQPKAQSQQVKEVLDLTLDLDKKILPDVTGDIISPDLGLKKGDSTVIVPDNNLIIDSSSLVIEYPDVEAEFPGGFDKWKDYLLSELVYPEISIEQGECGQVYIGFTVQTDGSITDVKVVRGVSRYLDSEAKRVIRSSPKWIPAMVGKNKVITKMTIPINFVLE